MLKLVAIAPVVAASCLLLAEPAQASACKNPGSDAAGRLDFYSGAEPVIDGLGISFQLGMEPASFPVADIRKAKDACTRTTFEAGGATWTLFGDDDDSPPRWATRDGDLKRVAYLVFMPTPKAAWDWRATGAASSNGGASFTDWMWALTIAEGNQRRVHAFYDAEPSDARLVSDMREALEGRSLAVAAYDMKKHDFDADRVIGPLSLLTIATKAKSFPVDSPAGDRSFTRDPASGVLAHDASGLRCPATLAGLRLTSTPVTGGADQEVGCRYAGPQARIAVFVTRLPGTDFRSATTLAIAQPASRSVRQPAGLTLQMPKEAEVASAAFEQTDGAQKQIWVMKRSDWILHVNAVYARGGEATAAEAVSAILNAYAPTD